MERVNARERASLFNQALEKVSIGDSIRCTGLDDNLLCSNLGMRDDLDCRHCDAVGLVYEKATLAGKGTLRKINPPQL